MSNDKFARYLGGVSGPATQLFAVTPDDDNDLPSIGRAFIVGTEGSVAIRSAAGDEAVLRTCLAGYVYPIRCSRIKATGTSATDIVVLL